MPNNNLKKRSSCTQSSLRFYLVAVPFFIFSLMGLYSSTEVNSADHYERKTYDWRNDTKRLDNGGKTICRLAKRVRNKSPGQSLQEYFCVYRGANGTTETILVDNPNDCQKEIVCEYDPSEEKRPTIKEVLESLRKAME